MAHAAALVNPRIRADVVEISEFPTLAERYAVMGVPKTVISDVVEFVGAVPERTFIEHLKAAAEKVKKAAQPQS